MAWKPTRVRPTGKPGSAAFPGELVGLTGRDLQEGWKRIRAKQDSERLAKAIVDASGPKVGFRKRKPPAQDL